MIAPMALAPIFPYYLASPTGFKIPFVRILVKYLRAIPVPSSVSAMGVMYHQIVDLLKDGGKLVVAPEGSEWPYYNKIRNFKKGSFTFAVKAEVPILPIVYSYRKQRGIWLWRKRPTINMEVCEMISPYKEDGTLKTANELLNETKTVYDYKFYNSLKENKENVEI